MKKTSLILILLLSALLVVGVLGCSSTQKETASTDATEADEAATKSDDSQKTEQPATPPSTEAPAQPDNQAKQLFAVIETNKGTIVFQLFPHKAPGTVDSFIKLANSGFYDGIKWHRVEPGFVIQGGDPLSKDNLPENDGTGGPGYEIKAEINDVPHLKGTVAMAHNAKSIDSAGSQFYICLNDQPQLDGQYTVFGKVTEGMDVVEQIQVYDVMTKVSIKEVAQGSQ